MQETQEQPPSPLALQQGYEPPDISVRGLLWFLFIFLMTAVVINFGIWFQEEYLLSRPRPADAALSAVPPIQQFAEPDVQPTETHNLMPWEDLAELHHAEAARFEQLGWKPDPQTGTAAIPDPIVSELAERYKARAAAPAGAGPSPIAAPATGPATAPTVLPTESTTKSGGQP